MNDRPQKSSPAPALPRPPRRWWRWLLVIVSVVAVIALGGPWLAWRLTHVVTNAGFVKAEMTLVAPELPGRIEQIHVEEGQWVHQGDVLLEIDPSSLDDRVKMAEAEVAHLQGKAARYRAKLELARREVPAHIEAAEQALAAARQAAVRARARESFLARQKERFAGLLADQAIGRARYEEIEAQWIAAQAEVRAAEAGVGAAEARLDSARASRSRIDEAYAGWQEALGGLEAARRGLDLARLTRDKSVIRAPGDGIVARVFPEPGDMATPGRSVVALFDPDSIYVEARFEETKLRHLRPGQRVTLQLDALGGRTLHGRIRVIHRAAAGEFALIPRDVTAGEFTKLTQRVPVEIDVEDDARELELIPGTSVRVAARKGGEDDR
ncbi:MAG: HlyD family secretion protein [Acidobacteriota bacterium]|nr:HlyD family secretion protein [Acidobacteriota bacterium]